MTGSDSERPPVTFLLLAYRQEAFIRAAVEAAFAQTYSPVEIILADDCSPDRTFEIMREMAAAYQGKHSVKLNQTAKNGGLAASINSAMAHATGELVVLAAGDDISLPHRVETLVAAWLRAGKPSGIASEVRTMDERGKEGDPSNWAAKRTRLVHTPRDEMLKRFASRQSDFVLPGCSAAWSMATWKAFGELAKTVANEDNAFSFRAILDRGVCLIEDALVCYRSHDSAVSNRAQPMEGRPRDYRRVEERAVRWATYVLGTCHGLRKDLRTATKLNLISPAEAQVVEDDIARTMIRLETQINWWQTSFFQRLKRFKDSPRQDFPRNVTALLPLDVHAAAWWWLASVKKRFTRTKAKS